MKKDVSYYIKKIRLYLWITRILYICTYGSMIMIFGYPITGLILSLSLLSLSNTSYRYYHYLKVCAAQLLLNQLNKLTAFQDFINQIKHEIENEQKEKDNS